MESTRQAARIVEARFSRLKVGNSPVEIHQPASEEDVLSLHDIVSDLFDENYHAGMTQKAHLRLLPNLQKFMETHCRITTYMFVVSRCQDQSCDFCGNEPSRLGHLVSHVSLRDPPLPKPDDANKGHYMKYSSLKGQFQMKVTVPPWMCLLKTKLKQKTERTQTRAPNRRMALVFSDRNAWCIILDAKNATQPG